MKVSLFLLVCLFCVNAGAEPKYANQNTQDAKKELIQFDFYAQGDALWFGGDTKDVVNHEVNFKDGVNVPRARFIVRGYLQDWFYVVTYDAAEENLKENYLRYTGFANAYFQFGQYKPAYSLWYSTGHRYYLFMERALPVVAFIPGYRIGAQLLLFQDPITFTVGMFGPDTANTFYGNQVKGHTPLGYSARFTFVPILSQNEVLHFGAAGMYQETDSTEIFDFQAYPEVQTYNNPSLVNTGMIPKCKHFYGRELEVFYKCRSFNIEAEYFSVLVNRQKQRNLDFCGYYVMADYFITGESYKYNFKEGLITGITPIQHCYGAWQLAVRYSAIDLQDENIQGGKEYNTTFGVNWYLNQNVRFEINYIRVNTRPSENGLDRDMNIVGLRCQLSA